MENITCYAENCKYNQGKCCTAREITIVTQNTEMCASCTDDTACEKFEPRN